MLSRNFGCFAIRRSIIFVRRSKILHVSFIQRCPHPLSSFEQQETVLRFFANCATRRLSAGSQGLLFGSVFASVVWRLSTDPTPAVVIGSADIPSIAFPIRFTGMPTLIFLF